MDVAITNSADLKLEIARLKAVKGEQENAIKQHFNSPRAILGTITSIFHKNKTGETTFDWSKYDISSLISKYLLPLTLNKTLFRKSGFIVRAIVAFASRKAAGFVNDEHVTALWDKLKPHLPEALVDKLTPKKHSSFFSFLKPTREKGPENVKRLN